MITIAIKGVYGHGGCTNVYLKVELTTLRKYKGSVQKW